MITWLPDFCRIFRMFFDALHLKESNELASTEETAAAGLVPPSTTEVELTSVDSPFLSQLHFALPFTMSTYSLLHNMR